MTSKLAILGVIFVTFTGVFASADSNFKCSLPGGMAGSDQVDLGTIRTFGPVFENCANKVVIQTRLNNISIVMPLSSYQQEGGQRVCTYLGRYNGEGYEADCTFPK
jgi:hypothetical protein